MIGAEMPEKLEGGSHAQFNNYQVGEQPRLVSAIANELHYSGIRFIDAACRGSHPY